MLLDQTKRLEQRFRITRAYGDAAGVPQTWEAAAFLLGASGVVNCATTAS